MKITEEQKALADKLTKLHIRPAVVKQEVMKLEPDVKECHVNNLVKNTRKRLGFYNNEKYHALNTKEKEKERKKPKHRNRGYHHKSNNSKKHRKLLITEDDFFS